MDGEKQNVCSEIENVSRETFSRRRAMFHVKQCAKGGSGVAAAKKKKTNSLMTALITATALVIFLLTVGFLIKGEEMAASSVLSLVSFGYAGVLFGAMVLHNPDRSKVRRTVFPRA